MAHRSRGSRGRVVSSRRQTAWTIGPLSGALGAPLEISTVANTLWAFGIEAAIEGLTLIRTRGFIELKIKVATAANDGFTGAIGLAIADVRAFDAGAGSLPRPFTDSDDEIWFWHQFFSMHPETTDESVAAAFMRIEIDSKAMRKFPEGMAMYGIIETASEIGAPTMQLFGMTRTLFKLP